MHFCTFVVIGRLGDVDKLVSKALAPFSENLKVPPRRSYLEKHQITLMAEHYNLEKHDLHVLAKHMEEWSGNPGGVDRKGLYETTTWNPDGRWDWYEIGGRWSGYIKDAERNVINVRALLSSEHLKDHLPCYVVTPAGVWLERERFFPDGFLSGQIERKADDQWLQEIRRALERCANCRAVCVDIHN